MSNITNDNHTSIEKKSIPSVSIVNVNSIIYSTYCDGSPQFYQVVKCNSNKHQVIPISYNRYHKASDGLNSKDDKFLPIPVNLNFIEIVKKIYATQLDNGFLSLVGDKNAIVWLDSNEKMFKNQDEYVFSGAFKSGLNASIYRKL